MSDDLVTKARALLVQATPGPWELDEAHLDIYAGDKYVAEFYEDVEIPDATLMASAPTLIPALCDEVEALRARVAELERTGRFPGCKCQWEEGDSPCPVHGEDELEKGGTA